MTMLAERACQDEQMDDPGLSPGVYNEVLADLARVNRLTLASRPTLSFLRRACPGSGSLRILDVGFGQGDMLRTIARWTRKRGIRAQLVGVDVNQMSVDAARRVTPPDMPIEFHAGGYRDVSGPFDVVISSLVAHHMTDGELVDFLRFMEAKARRGWLINDLRRHLASYLLYPAFARVIGAHRIVREDGRLSIARSFRPADWRELLQRAAVPRADTRIVKRLPYRLCVERLF